MNVERLKREAKAIKRAEGCTHTQALDLLAKREGYPNWALLMRAVSRQDDQPKVDATRTLP